MIRVTVARGKIRVRDNGPGIPPETVASILDFTTRTSSREAYVAPDRGRQGNALKTIVAMPFALSGEEGRVEIDARGIRHEITFRVDRIAQQPVIDHQQHQLDGASVRTGTSITVHWPNSACSDLEDAGGHFLPLVERFTDLNPHLSLCATWVDDDRARAMGMRRRSIRDWTKWTPVGADVPALVSAWPTSSASPAPSWLMTGSTRRSALLRDFLAQFDGLAGTAKRKAVLDAVGLQRAPLERLLNGGGEFDHDLVDRLLEAMQAAAPADQAGGARRRSAGTTSRRASTRYGADLETFRYKMVKGVDDGVPWVVEAAFAYVPDGRARQLICGVNWSPALGTDGDPFRLGSQLGADYCGDARADRPPGAPDLPAARVPRPRQEPAWRATRPASPRSERRSRRSPRTGRSSAQSRSATSRASRTRQEKLRVEQRAPELSLKDARAEAPAGGHRDRSSDERQAELHAARRVLRRSARWSSRSRTSRSPTATSPRCSPTIENEQGEIAGLQREPRGTLYHPHLRRGDPAQH